MASSPKRPHPFAPKPIADKASHPNFPHIQSAEQAEHADQPWASCKTQETSKMKPKNRKMADGQCKKYTEKAENREGRLCQGWLLGDFAHSRDFVRLLLLASFCGRVMPRSCRGWSIALDPLCSRLREQRRHIRYCCCLTCQRSSLRAHMSRQAFQTGGLGCSFFAYNWKLPAYS